MIADLILAFNRTLLMSEANMINGGDNLALRVHFAARDGMFLSLCSLLAECNPEKIKDVLSQFSDDEMGQKFTPLMVAARNGHVKVVSMLIARFLNNGIDLEAEGIVKADGYLVEKATALWCAACAGHLPVVKVLIRAGAKVDHATWKLSTPLRAAVYCGRLDIVEYLVAHEADINLANNYNNTCLMLAAYRGHKEILKVLLEKGADVNKQANCGASALHFASEAGHLDIVKLLINHGAKFYPSASGMTPLIAAAERTREDVVRYLVDQYKPLDGEGADRLITREQKVEALELLGASFANDKDNYCLELAYHYLCRAMKLRFSDPNNIIHKKLAPPVPAYENRIECVSVEELEAIEDDALAIQMESLAIRERILGRHNQEIPHPLIFRGAVFADQHRFDLCIQLWMYAVQLRQENQVPVTKDILRLAQAFSQMLALGIDLGYTEVELVLRAAILESRYQQNRLSEPGPEDEAAANHDEMDMIVMSILYLLVVATKVLRLNPNLEENSLSLSRLVFGLNKLNITTQTGETLLHLAVNASTPVDNFHIIDICKFPCPATAKLLIQCGADVNAMDHFGNTPLHVIIGYNCSVSEFLTLHSIITQLIEAGAHVDTVNNFGHTPHDEASTGVAEIILRTQAHLSLKCLAARAVQKYNLAFRGHVPKSLESFVELHGPKKFVDQDPHGLVSFAA